MSATVTVAAVEQKRCSGQSLRERGIMEALLSKWHLSRGLQVNRSWPGGEREESSPSRGNSRCKGPEVGKVLGCGRSGKQANALSLVRGRAEGGMGLEW